MDDGAKSEKSTSAYQKTKDNIKHLLSAIDRIDDPTFRFLLVMTLILVFGGPSLALTFGPLMGLSFVAIVLIFVFFVFLVDRKCPKEHKHQRTKRE